MKTLGILILLFGEGLSAVTLWTAWHGKGMKDPIASVLLFIPCVAAVAVGYCFYGHWAAWWLWILPGLVCLDVALKLKRG